MQDRPRLLFLVFGSRLPTIVLLRLRKIVRFVNRTNTLSSHGSQTRVGQLFFHKHRLGGILLRFLKSVGRFFIVFRVTWATRICWHRSSRKRRHDYDDSNLRSLGCHAMIHYPSPPTHPPIGRHVTKTPCRHCARALQTSSSERDLWPRRK